MFLEGFLLSASLVRLSTLDPRVSLFLDLFPCSNLYSLESGEDIQTHSWYPHSQMQRLADG